MPLDSQEHRRAQHQHLECSENDNEPIHLQHPLSNNGENHSLRKLLHCFLSLLAAYGKERTGARVIAGLSWYVYEYFWDGSTQLFC